MVLLKLVAISVTLASLASGKENTDYRLPRNIWPQLYDLKLRINVGEKTSNFTFQGKVDIKLQSLSNTDSITLHSKELDILTEKTMICDKDGESLNINCQHYDVSRDFFIIKLSKPLKANITYVLSLVFEGVLDEGLAGLYRSSYKDRKTGETRWLAVSQFEATDARRAFPCFDEPEFKAHFKITLVRVKLYNSLSNMPLLSSDPLKDDPGWVADHYQVTEHMSTYLVAFVVSDFGCHESKEHPSGVIFRVCARCDALEQTQFASEVGPKLLEYFESYFNTSYPLPKQDMLAIPDFSAGAMENWGLITYREQLLLYDPKVSSAESKMRVASVISHELAHQWFGNLVTMRWWSDLWLNEGFATYVASLGLQYANPEWNALQTEAVESLLAVLTSDSLETSHPVSVEISHPRVIGQIFDAISYKKGGLLLRMMNMFLGEDVFAEGVSKYLHAHQYSNAMQDDLWGELTEVAHRCHTLADNMTVKQVMDTWTLQTGYPLVTVTRNFVAGTINIVQQRYLSYRKDHPQNVCKTNTTSPCWLIPISYTAQLNPDFDDTSPKLWISCEQPNITFKDEFGCNQWLIFNIKVSGPFRVNYDTKNWNMIQKTLNSDDFKKIGVMNRVQLIDDVMDLAWTGDVNYNITLQLLNYLPRETEYLPWRTAFSNIYTLNHMLKRTMGYGAFRMYLRMLLCTTYKRLGDLMNQKTDSYEATKHHNLIVTWACRLNFENCLDQACSLYRTWMECDTPDENNTIPRDFRSVVYCTAIKYGGEREWEFAWQRYLHSNVVSEKMALLTSLSCTRETWLLKSRSDIRTNPSILMALTHCYIDGKNAVTYMEISKTKSGRTTWFKVGTRIRYLEWAHGGNKDIRRQDSYNVFLHIASSDVGFPIAKDFFFQRISDIYKFYQTKPSILSRYIKALTEKMYQKAELKEFETFAIKNDKYLKESQLMVKQGTETVQVNIQWHKKYYSTFVAYLEAKGEKELPTHIL